MAKTKAKPEATGDSLRIQMLVPISGPEWNAGAGEVVTRPTAEANSLIKAGYARPASRGLSRETAVSGPAETA